MSVFGIALLALLFAWLLGGLLLRLAGLMLVFAGTIGMALSGDPNAILIAALGLALWLLGHRHYALRRGEWKSRLAAALWAWIGSALRRLLGPGPTYLKAGSDRPGRPGEEAGEVIGRL